MIKKLFLAFFGLFCAIQAQAAGDYYNNADTAWFKSKTNFLITSSTDTADKGFTLKNNYVGINRTNPRSALDMGEGDIVFGGYDPYGGGGTGITTRIGPRGLVIGGESIGNAFSVNSGTFTWAGVFTSTGDGGVVVRLSTTVYTGDCPGCLGGIELFVTTAGIMGLSSGNSELDYPAIIISSEDVAGVGIGTIPDMRGLHVGDNGKFDGSVTATTFIGDGTNLSNVAILNAQNVFTSSNTFSYLKFTDGNQNSGKVLTSDANGNVSWQDATGGTSTLYLESYTVGTASSNYTGSSTVFNLVSTFTANGMTLNVYYDGILMLASTDYTEDSTSQITFASARTTGHIVTFKWYSDIGATGSISLGGNNTFTGINTFTNTSNVFYGDGSHLSGISGSVAYSTFTATYYIGEVFVSSIPVDGTFNPIPGLFTLFRSTDVTITGVRAYSEYTPSYAAEQTTFDIVVSTVSGNTRTWESIFTSTTPWINSDMVYSNWFVPDAYDISAASEFAIAPRIISIPVSAPLPQIMIEVRYKRRLDQ